MGTNLFNVGEGSKSLYLTKAIWDIMGFIWLLSQSWLFVDQSSNWASSSSHLGPVQLHSEYPRVSHCQSSDDCNLFLLLRATLGQSSPVSTKQLFVRREKCPLLEHHLIIFLTQIVEEGSAVLLVECFGHVYSSNPSGLWGIDPSGLEHFLVGDWSPWTRPTVGGGLIPLD